MTSSFSPAVLPLVSPVAACSDVVFPARTAWSEVGFPALAASDTGSVAVEALVAGYPAEAASVNGFLDAAASVAVPCLILHKIIFLCKIIYISRSIKRLAALWRAGLGTM